MKTNLSKLSESKLRALRANLDAERDAITEEMIACGRGHETSAETQAKDDPLALRFRASCAAFSALREEEEFRKRWHGSLRPVRSKLSDILDR